MNPGFPKNVAAVCVCVVLIGGCAYLNTFYNAKASFDLASKEFSKQAALHPDSTVLPTGEALTNFDRAYEKASKVIEVYPKKKKWHDDAVYLMARISFEKGEYPKTIRIVRQFQKEYPQSPFVPESYLLLGRANMLGGNLDRAEELFQIVVEKYPWLNRNDEVSLSLARIAIEREGKALAIELLEEIRNSVRSVGKKIDLVLEIARLYMDLHQYDKAVRVLRTAPRRDKLGQQMFSIDFLMLRSLIELDSLDQAQAMCMSMLANKRYERHEGELLNKKGILFKLRGSMDEALKVFELVTRKWDTGLDAGEAWYELGLLYQKEKGDFEKAQECYEKASSLLKGTETGDLATERVTALNKLGSLRTKLAESDSLAQFDTTGVGDTLHEEYEIGELFWLELDQPDSAYRFFAAIASDTTVDSLMQAKSLYAAGYLCLNALNDTTRADSLFHLLITVFPEDAHSKRAEEDRDWSRTVQTPEDVAHDEFREAEKLLYQKRDPVGAANAFLKVYRKWPDLDIAPQSLHAAAWVCDEILCKNETARKLYEKLCEEYPRSANCLNGARPRLKTVLDTLESLKESGTLGSSKDKRRETSRKSRRPVRNAVSRTVPGDSAMVDTPEEGWQ